MGDMETGSGPNGCGPNGCVSGTCSPSSCDPTKYEISNCDKSSCNQADETPLDEEFVAARLQLESVRVPSMDAEHVECAKALRVLADEPSAASLEAVLAAFSEHFAHEQSLFDEHGFGEHANQRFSAKRTHIDDHNRLLEKIRLQLRSHSVPIGFVRELLQDFHEHTSRYDVQYSQLFSSKGVI